MFCLRALGHHGDSPHQVAILFSRSRVRERLNKLSIGEQMQAEETYSCEKTALSAKWEEMSR